MDIAGKIGKFIIPTQSVTDDQALPLNGIDELDKIENSTKSTVEQTRGSDKHKYKDTYPVFTHTKGMLWCDYTNSAADIWVNADEMMPFEGVFISRLLNEKDFIITESSSLDAAGQFQTFPVYEAPPTFSDGAILNLPEFIDWFYFVMDADAKAIDGVAYFMKTPYWFFLNSMPFNPPYPPMLPSPKADNTVEKVEQNPSMLFKNTAGIFSIPQLYSHWLGGMWRSYQGQVSLEGLQNFVSVHGTIDEGITKVVCTIDPAGKDTNFFRYGNYYEFTDKLGVNDTPTILVNFDKFPNLTHSGITPKTVNLGDGVYAVDTLEGFGVFTDFFATLYGYFHNLPASTTISSIQAMSLVEANLATMLRTFNTYKHALNSYVELNSYGTYSIMNYNPPVDEISTDLNKPPFDVYSEIWNKFYQYLSNGNDYLTARTKIVDSFGGIDTTMREGVSLVTAIQTKLFNQISVGNSATYTLNDKSYIKNNGLFSPQNTPLQNCIDLIGSMVLRFMNDRSAVPSTVYDQFFVSNTDLVISLYPSGGGANSMIYAIKLFNDVLGGLEKIKPLYSNNRVGVAAETDGVTTTDKSVNDYVSAMFLNMLMNSCHYLWYTGPYMGLTCTNLDTNFRSFLEPDNSSLSKLSSNLLYMKDEFTATQGTLIPRKSRTYVMDSTNYYGTRGATADINMPFRPMFNYFGSAFLDFCGNEFDSACEGTNPEIDAKSVFLWLLVVDKSNFTNINVDGVEYSVKEQIDLVVLYDNLLAQGYRSGTAKETDKNLLAVINAALSNAQLNKAKSVAARLSATRHLIKNGSVYEYLQAGTVENRTHESLSSNIVKETNGTYIAKFLFGTQKMPSYIYGQDTALQALYDKYLISQYSGSQLYYAVSYFFDALKVQPDENVLKISKDILTWYLNLAESPDSKHFNTALATIAGLIEQWLKKGEAELVQCLKYVSRELAKLEVAEVDKKVKENNVFNLSGDLSKLKQRTYYNIKTLYDNWISVAPNAPTVGQLSSNLQLVYNHNSIPYANEVPETSTGLASHFLFYDRANRDIGDHLLVNLQWLRTFYDNNFGYQNNTNISLYTFLSELAKNHSSLIHALPSFIDFGTMKMNAKTDSPDYAGQLFDTFDYIDFIEASPKFIFQYIGNTNTVLSTSQNDKVRSRSKTYLLSNQSNGNCAKLKKGNSLVNLKDGAAIPKDLADAYAVSFVVDFGAEGQQMFSNLQVDQSEYQNTEEYYNVITNVVNNQPKTQSADLFTIFTERSYTATVDSLGNLMIQPLMFFDLVNVPLFYGNYWITNVKHSITPNDIKTTFKGVRQPMAVLPTKGEVLMQLATQTINSLYGTNLSDAMAAPNVDYTSLQEITGTPAITKGGGYFKDLQDKPIVYDWIQAQKDVKAYLKAQGFPKENELAIIAGIMGNIFKESAFCAAAVSPPDDHCKKKPGTRGRNYGLIQWNSCVWDFAEDIINKSVMEQMVYVTTQTSGYDTFLKEMEAEKNGLAAPANNGASYAAYRFAALVEICAHCDKGVSDYLTGGATQMGGSEVKPAQRSQYAVSFYNRFGDSSDFLYDGTPFVPLAVTTRNTLPKQITTPNVRIFVFGDSHVAGGLGAAMQTEIAKLNGSARYEFYGENGTGYKNRFTGQITKTDPNTKKETTVPIYRKTELISRIKKFNPDIVIAILGTKDYSYNKTDYSDLMLSVSKFFNADFALYPIALVTPFAYPEPEKTLIKHVADGVVRAASKYNYQCVDVYHDSKYTLSPQYKKDQWDLTTSGYQWEAQNIVNGLVGLTFTPPTPTTVAQSAYSPEVVNAINKSLVGKMYTKADQTYVPPVNVKPIEP